MRVTITGHLPREHAQSRGALTAGTWACSFSSSLQPACSPVLLWFTPWSCEGGAVKCCLISDVCLVSMLTSCNDKKKTTSHKSGGEKAGSLRKGGPPKPRANPLGSGFHLYSFHAFCCPLFLLHHRKSIRKSCSMSFDWQHWTTSFWKQPSRPFFFLLEELGSCFCFLCSRPIFTNSYTCEHLCVFQYLQHTAVSCALNFINELITFLYHTITKALEMPSF